MARRHRTPAAVTPDELRALMQAMQCHTQQEFAEQLSVTQGRVSQILSGAYPLKPGPLLTLVRQFQAQYLPDRDPRT